MQPLDHFNIIPTIKEIDKTKAYYEEIYIPESGENHTHITKWRLEDSCDIEKYYDYKMIFSAYCGQFAEYNAFHKLNESNLRVILEHIESIEDEYDDSFDFYDILYINGHKILCLHKDTAKEDIISIMEMILSTCDYIILDDENFFICESCNEGHDRILDDQDGYHFTENGELCSYCYEDKDEDEDENENESEEI